MRKVVKNTLVALLFSLVFLTTTTNTYATTCKITTLQISKGESSSTYKIAVEFSEQISARVTVNAGYNYGSPMFFGETNPQKILMTDFEVIHNRVDSTANTWNAEAVMADGTKISCRKAFDFSEINPGEDNGGDTNQSGDNALNTDISTAGPSNATFDALNPLKSKFSTKEFVNDNNKITPANIIARVLNYLFPISGMILFIMIVWGGFEMLSTSATKKSMDAGKQRITAAVLGFLLLFASYWIVQIIEVVFGVKIL